MIKEMEMHGRRWISMAIVLLSIACKSVSQSSEDSMSSKTTNNKPRIFSPRMDYDEWTPLGHGDPLKNDPTFDYVPPVLDRVQYWLDSPSSTEASSKRDILILGVTAKKTSPKIHNHILKFMDSSKFTRHPNHHSYYHNSNNNNNNNNNNNHHHHHHHHNQKQQQQQQEDQENYRKDLIGTIGNEPPKVNRVINIKNGVGMTINTNSLDFRNHNPIQNIPASYYPSPYYNEKSEPYTMMMPPPIRQSHLENQYQNGIQSEKISASSIFNPNENPNSLTNSMTLPSSYNIPIFDTNQLPSSLSITSDKSKLVYQTSEILDHWTPAINNNDYLSEHLIVWNANNNVKSYDRYANDHNVAASANHEVVIGQNANIIVDSNIINEEQVILGRKEIIPLSNNVSVFNNNNNDSTYNNNSSSSSSSSSSSNKNSSKVEGMKMHIVFANISSEVLNGSDTDMQSEKITPTIIVPSNYVKSIEYLGSMGNLSTIISTTPLSTSLLQLLPSKQYFTSSTPLTQMVSQFPLTLQTQNDVNRSIQKQEMNFNLSTTLTTTENDNHIENVSQSSEKNQKRPINETDRKQLTSSLEKIIYHRSQLAAILDNGHIRKKTVENPTSKATMVKLTSMATTVTPISSSSSIIESPTSSVLFNYKQPSELDKPLSYLIIQGHSKVKTYKPTVNRYGIPVEKNSIDMENITKQFISQVDKFVNKNTRIAPLSHRNAMKNNPKVKAEDKQVKQNSLISFVESGISAFTVSTHPSLLPLLSFPTSLTSPVPAPPLHSSLIE